MCVLTTGPSDYWPSPGNAQAQGPECVREIGWCPPELLRVMSRTRPLSERGKDGMGVRDGISREIGWHFFELVG
jgi:hypothetical protein